MHAAMRGWRVCSRMSAIRQQIINWATPNVWWRNDRCRRRWRRGNRCLVRRCPYWMRCMRAPVGPIVASIVSCRRSIGQLRLWTTRDVAYQTAPWSNGHSDQLADDRSTCSTSTPFVVVVVVVASWSVCFRASLSFINCYTTSSARSNWRLPRFCSANITPTNSDVHWKVNEPSYLV